MIRSATAALVALAMFPAAPPLVAQAGGSPSVTLFSSGRALVRRTLPIKLPVGSSTHPLVLGLFDASTFAALDPGVQVGMINFNASFDEQSLLRRHIGRVFTFQVYEGKPPVTARLVALDPERWEVLAGNGDMLPGVSFSRPGRIIWEPELVPAAPIADVTLSSEHARDNISVMYEAPGGSWNAGYRIFLGARSRIEGMATIDAGTLDLANTEVQLLAGEIGQKVQPQAPSRPYAMAMRASDMSNQEMSAEAVGEARLYTLPGRVSFTPATQMVLPLFTPTTVAPELRLTVPGTLPFYGGFGQETDEVEVPVLVSYRLAHEQGSTFGDLALPAGGVSVYDTDKAGRVQLVGNGGIGHTAPGEQVEVNTGIAFDVTARRTQTEYTTVHTDKPSRTTATVGYSVVVKNAKDTAVTVEVREDRGGEWSVISSSVPAVKKSSSRTVFMLRVPPKGEAPLTYRLRVVW